ncbi:hypothetical protein HPB47_007366 [Ixodes persulcatus]|uniref:Uncharacterized protein n=1 Tax=Ixodes persulcatus TaxID=34615 RepID=A0AC60P851_IXOPE|nr:hypothetical protein HPB47_007366 [Ixodes persulcatus]
MENTETLKREVCLTLHDTQEETLQHACDTVARYALSIGLACSPSKSELLVISNRKNNPDRQLITVHLDGTPIPQRPQIKLLGLTIQNTCASVITVSTLSKQINQITHILGRVSCRHRGLKESDMRRAIEALIYSLVLYHIPYTPLTIRQLKHLQTQLQPTRLALGVPQYAPLEHLQQMDPFNTLEERVDLHRLGQQQRLTTSLQGRYILNSLGYDTLHLPPIETTTPPWDTIPQITTLPIPKHMNPDCNPERLKHSAKLISQKFATLQAQQHLIYYTDASYDRGTKLGRTAIHCPQTNTTLRQTYTEAPSADLLETQALRSAIHHAIANPHEAHTSITVLTDSQKAVRTFQYNQLPNCMSRELRAALNTTPTLRFYIYWIPGHALIPGNERAHSLSRVTSTPGPAIDWPTSYDPQLQRNEYHQQRSDTLRQLRESRLALVPPPPTPSRQQASTLRRAQTHTLSSPHYTHLFQGAQGTAECPFCTGYPNDTHTYWQCLHAQPSIRSTLSKLPPGLPPTTWKEWLSPTNHQHVPAIFDALLHHITTI